MSERELPSVSVVVPILDEAAAFDAAIGSVTAQDYAGKIEFVFVDGGSCDGTRERLAKLAERDTRVRVVDNSRRGIPASLNLGLRAARNEILVRMDAHSKYAADYVSHGASLLESGRAEWVAGPAYARGEGTWSRWVAIALASRMGAGGADFRRSAEEMYTDTLFGGAIHRDALVRLGGWDERWVWDEDSELAARARAVGWRLLLAPSMAADYMPRDDPVELARQYWRYGMWRARTSVRHPTAMRPSHVLPPVVVLTLAAALLPMRAARFARFAAASYIAAIAEEGIRVAAGRPAPAVRLMATYALMHLPWGAANILGFARFGSPAPAIRHVFSTVAARAERRFRQVGTRRLIRRSAPARVESMSEATPPSSSTSVIVRRPQTATAGSPASAIASSLSS